MAKLNVRHSCGKVSNAIKQAVFALSAEFLVVSSYYVLLSAKFVILPFFNNIEFTGLNVYGIPFLLGGVILIFANNFKIYL